MAFGFTPKFEQSYDLNGLDPKQYLIIALDAAKKLGWDIGYISKSGFIAYIGGGMFSSAEEFKLTIQDGSVNIISKTISSGMVDWGRNKSHIEDFVEEFEAMQPSFTDDELNQKFHELAGSLPPDDEDKLLLPPATAKDNFKGFLSFFVPNNNYFITPIIIDLNIGVFILMVACGVSFIAPNTVELITWGANFRAVTLSGGWWRLLTNIFLHVGIFHLLLNMYALLYIGLLLEPYLGRARFLAAYIFTGILASLTSVYWHPVTVSAGASGAIFGMYGVFLAMLTTNIIDRSARKALLTSIGVFVVLNLANGVKDGIDNAAHIGGLSSGLLIGYLYYPSLNKPLSAKFKYGTLTLLGMLVLVISTIAYRTIPNDIGAYDNKMNLFSKNEEAALMIFRLQNPSKDAALAGLNSGLRNWNENLQIINDIEKLDIPEELKLKDDKLKQYCQLRIKSYTLIYKQVNENSKQYESQILQYNQQIQAIINQLKGEQ